MSNESYKVRKSTGKMKKAFVSQIINGQKQVIGLIVPSMPEGEFDAYALHRNVYKTYLGGYKKIDSAAEAIMNYKQKQEEGYE